MAARPVLYLIDGYAVAYRYFYALRSKSFRTRSGEPTNALFGFSRFLLDILQKGKPKYVAVALDRGLSGREKIYAEYKGTREKMPDDLRLQIIRIEQLVRAFNMPLLMLDGYEADDVIGTIVAQASEQKVDVHIITGDQDLLQLLSDTVRVQLPARDAPDIIYDIQRFQETHDGLHPSQLVDFKALVGDTSDNIPGVKGIGKKNATQLLLTYETLDGIYENVELIKSANQKKLLVGKEDAYLSQQLATIQQDLPIELDLQSCLTQDYDLYEVDALFAELEFRSLRNRLVQPVYSQLPLFALMDEDSGYPLPPELVPTHIVRDQTALDELIVLLNQAEAIVWDVETTSIDQMQAVLVGISVAVDGEAGYYIPVGHRNGDQLPLDTVIEALRAPLTNPAIPKYAHNASYDLVVMRRYGIDVTPITFDTMIAEWVRDPISRYLGLKNLARQYLGVFMTEIRDLLGTGKKQISMDAVAVPRVAPYAAADAAITYRAASYLHEELKHDPGALKVFNELEIPLIPIIASMEQAGVKLDVPYLNIMSQDLAKQLSEIETRIYEISGFGEFNINSPKQLNQVLFEHLNLPVEGLKKTSYGYSTDVTTLEALRDKHKIIEHILEYRELSKLKSTYVDALPELINAKTGRVHTSYNQTGTATGRFSSSNPNLQNIPIRTQAGRDVRRAFVAPNGMLLLAVDYSQIELRVMAHISQDETLIEAFLQGQDIHQATAAAVYGVAPDTVTYEQRSFAKRVNFGLMYGMGAFRLARDSDLTLAEAEGFINTYFSRLPGVKAYIDNIKSEVREKGYVETLFGRRRYFPLLEQNKKGQRAAGEERAAINMPIQGSAADILKKAILDLAAALAAEKSQAQMILQVHDELVLEVPEDELEKTTRLVKSVMEGAFVLDVPLVANASYGRNWLDMQDISLTV